MEEAGGLVHAGCVGWASDGAGACTHEIAFTFDTNEAEDLIQLRNF